MSTSTPIKKEYDIPIVKPVEIPEEPRRLNPGVPAPMYVPWGVESVPERVPARRYV